METKQIVKSRTINFNAFMPIILMVLPKFGIVVTPELTAAILGIGNIILRFMTDKSVNDK